MNRIVYVGVERCDFLYHFINILSTKGDVLVADNSIYCDLFTSVCKEKDENVYEWRNVTYVKNVDITSSNTSDYDYVVIYAGMDPLPEYYNDPETFVLVMPDYTAQCLEVVDGIYEDITKCRSLVILRDFCTKKITDKSVATLLNMNPKMIEGHITLTAQDMAAYVALTHNGHQNIKGVSGEMLTALTFATARYFETDEKKAQKIVASARKIK